MGMEDQGENKSLFCQKQRWYNMTRAPQVCPKNRPCHFNARMLCKPRSDGLFLCPLQGRVFGDFLSALTQYFLSSPYKAQSMTPGGGRSTGDLLPGQAKLCDIGKCIQVEDEGLVREFWHTGKMDQQTCKALCRSIERFGRIRFAYRYDQD